MTIERRHCSRRRWASCHRRQTLGAPPILPLRHSAERHSSPRGGVWGHVDSRPWTDYARSRTMWQRARRGSLGSGRGAGMIRRFSVYGLLPATFSWGDRTLTTAVRPYNVSGLPARFSIARTTSALWSLASSAGLHRDSTPTMTLHAAAGSRKDVAVDDGGFDTTVEDRRCIARGRAPFGNSSIDPSGVQTSGSTVGRMCPRVRPSSDDGRLQRG